MLENRSLEFVLLRMLLPEAENSDEISYGQFGPLIMGEGWVSHHGRHKLEGARGIVEAANAAHPILKGVTDVFGPSDVYGIKRLTDEDTILMRGAVTATLAPDSSFVDSKMIRCNRLLGYTHTQHPTVRKEPPLHHDGSVC